MGLIFPVHIKTIYERNIRSPLAVSVVYFGVTKYKSFSSYLKHEVFSCERKRREAMLGGSVGIPSPPPDFFLKKGAIWCILGHILAFKTLLFFKINLKNVTFADKSEKKRKKKET